MSTVGASRALTAMVRTFALCLLDLAWGHVAWIRWHKDPRRLQQLLRYTEAIGKRRARRLREELGLPSERTP